MTAPNTNGDMPDKPVSPVSSGRWLRIALAVSLAINLGIGGVVAGAMFRNRGGMHDGMMARDLGFGPFTEALSKDDRGALRRAFLAKVPELRDGRRAMKKDFSALLEELRAVPFDEVALRDVFDRQNQRNTERLKLGQDLIFDLVVAMTTEARQAFAGRLEAQLARGPKQKEKLSAP